MVARRELLICNNGIESTFYNRALEHIRDVDFTASLQAYIVFVMIQRYNNGPQLVKSRKPDHYMNSASNSSWVISPFLTFLAIRSSRASSAQSSSLPSSSSPATRPLF